MYTNIICSPSLLTPDIGILVWTTITFLILLILLRKFAWLPILNAVKSREEHIDNALNAAKIAQQDNLKLQAENQEVLKQARAERDGMIKDAKELKNQMVNEAKKMAETETEKIRQAALVDIQNEKNAVMDDLKAQVANLAVDIAEKIMKENLSKDDTQKKYISGLVNDIKIK